MRLFKRKAVVKNSHTPLPPKLANLLREAWWLLMAVAAVYLVLVLASYSPLDPSWSHSSADRTVRNYGGAFGAWLSDLLLYVFGLSAWWLVVFCGAIVLWGYRNIRRVSPALDKVTAIASTGFVMILVASSGFEAIRFYSLDINLPLAPGGLLGRFVGLGLQQFIGFAGATMLLLLVWAIGISLFTGLSWLDLMEKMLHEDDLRIFPEDLYAQGHVLHSPEAVVYSPKELMEMDWLDECVEGALPHYDELDVKTHVLMAINGLNTLKGFVK